MEISKKFPPVSREKMVKNFFFIMLNQFNNIKEVIQEDSQENSQEDNQNNNSWNNVELFKQCRTIQWDFILQILVFFFQNSFIGLIKKNTTCIILEQIASIPEIVRLCLDLKTHTLLFFTYSMHH